VGTAGIKSTGESSLRIITFDTRISDLICDRPIASGARNPSGFEPEVDAGVADPGRGEIQMTDTP
jgi:hypothetical protein